MDCALTKTLKNAMSSAEQRLTPSERNKKNNLEHFLRRVDLFKGCLDSNIETGKRKSAENHQRFESDVLKVQTFFEHLSRIFSEAYVK